MIEKKKLSLVINGRVMSSALVTGASLADFLHENLGLTGTKVSCAIGVCKACTVAIRKNESDALARMQACITRAEDIVGYEVLTIEGIESHPKFRSIQESFLRNFSFQCGYCTPGFVMGTCILIDILSRNPIQIDKLDDFISDSLGDHICRCTGYVRYYKAIKEVILGMPGLVSP